MPFLYTTASQAIPSVNSTNQLTLDNNTPYAQAQSTSSGGRTVKKVASKSNISCCFCDATFAKLETRKEHTKIKHKQQFDEVLMSNKRLMISYVTDALSKISNPKALASYNKLLDEIKGLSFERMYAIFMQHTSENKFDPNGLSVFMNKLTLFTEEVAKMPYYKANMKVELDTLACSSFVGQQRYHGLKVYSIIYFMQQTDEQIKKTAQNKETCYFLVKGDYPKKDSQAIFDNKLQENLDKFTHDDFEDAYPNILDKIKKICKQKKIFFEKNFKFILNYILFTEDLSIAQGKEILEKIISFLTCIDDQNQYMDTSMLFLLFGFYESTDPKTLSSIIKFKPQVLEQIAKKPQLLEYAKQFEGEVYYIIEKHLEDENKAAKSQTAHNNKVTNFTPETVIDLTRELVEVEQQGCNVENSVASVEITNPVAVAAGRQVRNIENLESSIESKRLHNLAITKQIEEVINNCHQDKANILGDLNVTICSTCIQKNISMKDGLLDIFRTLSKKYISCKDAESISTKLKAVVKNLPDNIKIENTDFLNIICGNGGTGYINGLLALKECSVDEMIEAIKDKFRSDVFSEKYDLVINLTEYSQDESEDKSNNTPALTREISARNKRPLDNSDNFPLDNKRFKK
jgi:predicted house-cleaning noncanonical NTP pyrophosphatase (MazG superfamily)